MPSLPDTAVIILLGLLLFGPKGLAQIARQLGKLMGEFRRASNEFRMQMEEELRISEQTDRQKQIAAVEAAAPMALPLHSASADELLEEHPHLPTLKPEPEGRPAPVQEPLPISSSGDLSIMPPATGLPAARSSSSGSGSTPLSSTPLSSTALSSTSLSSLIDAVPKVDPPGVHGNDERSLGDLPNEQEQRKEEAPRLMRYSNQNGDLSHEAQTEESLHG